MKRLGIHDESEMIVNRAHAFCNDNESTQKAFYIKSLK